MHMEGADGEIEENQSALSSLDPNSPMEQDDSVQSLRELMLIQRRIRYLAGFKILSSRYV